MIDTENTIEELREKLKELESNYLRTYNECKSIIGWPLVGDNCPNKPKYFSDKDFDLDAKKTITKWILFLEQQINVIYAMKDVINKKFKHYEGEKVVPNDKIITGKPVESAFESGRVLEL